MDARLIKEALTKGKAEKLSEEVEYVRFKDSFRKVERGTVILGKKIIWGYPQIKRIFVLGNGLKKNTSKIVLYAEEKIDGFNVRILYFQGKIYAFSRGGFLDSFVTEKCRDMNLEKFFHDYPDYVLCGEMIGNTPYTEPTNEFDVKLFIFDIDEGDGYYLSCKEKYSILKKYKLNSTPFLGKFSSDDYEGLRSLSISINKGNKEGFVLRDEDRKVIMKYVTPISDIRDISEASDMLFDMPIGFFYQRILRSAFFLDEFALDRKKYSSKLGTAFYDGLCEAIKKVKNGEDISAEFEILIKDPLIWNNIHKHMSKKVILEELWRKKQGKNIRIRFKKIYKKSTKKLTSLATGKALTD